MTLKRSRKKRERKHTWRRDETPQCVLCHLFNKNCNFANVARTTHWNHYHDLTSALYQPQYVSRTEHAVIFSLLYTRIHNGFGCYPGPLPFGARATLARYSRWKNISPDGVFGRDLRDRGCAPLANVYAVSFLSLRARGSGAAGETDGSQVETTVGVARGKRER